MLGKEEAEARPRSAETSEDQQRKLVIESQPGIGVLDGPGVVAKARTLAPQGIHPGPHLEEPRERADRPRGKETEVVSDGVGDRRRPRGVETTLLEKLRER